MNDRRMTVAYNFTSTINGREAGPPVNCQNEKRVWHSRNEFEEHCTPTRKCAGDERSTAAIKTQGRHYLSHKWKCAHNSFSQKDKFTR